MKTLIAAALIACSARASTNCLIWFTGTNNSGPCVVATNQTAKVISGWATGAASYLQYVSIDISRSGVFYASFPHPFSNAFQTVVGPANITINGGGNANGFATIQLDTPEIYATPSTAVVIPTDATGPVQIILESSADMANWTQALPGTYGNSYSNRFFRLRAQRTP